MLTKQGKFLLACLLVMFGTLLLQLHLIECKKKYIYTAGVAEAVHAPEAAHLLQYTRKVH